MALETNLNKKRKRKKETLPVQPVAWRPARAGLPLLPSWLGQAEPSRSSVSLPRPRGPAQEPLLPRAFSSVSLTSGPRMSAVPFFLSS
jgi:hypothetical protein